MVTETPPHTSAPLRAYYGVTWAEAVARLQPSVSVYLDPLWSIGHLGCDAAGNQFLHVGDGPGSVLITSTLCDFEAATDDQPKNFVYAIGDLPDHGPMEFHTVCAVQGVDVAVCRDARDRGILFVEMKARGWLLVIDPLKPLPVDSIAGIVMEHGVAHEGPICCEESDTDRWLEAVQEYREPGFSDVNCAAAELEDLLGDLDVIP